MESKQDYIDALDSLKCLAFQRAIDCHKDITMNKHHAAGVIAAAFFCGAITREEERDLLQSFFYWGPGLQQQPRPLAAANDAAASL